MPAPCRTASPTAARTVTASTSPRILGPCRAAPVHRRLAIIDLSTEANQPFVKDGIVLVYNGELYNYRQLRAELESHGVRFRTASDTEVVLEAWRFGGEAWLAASAGCSPSPCSSRPPGAWCWRGTTSGSSPCSWPSARRAWPSPASSRRCGRAGRCRGRPNGHRRLAALLLGAREPLRHQRGGEAAGRLLGREVARTVAGAPVLRPRRGLGHRDHGIDADELEGILEDSVSAHLIADVPVSTFLSGGLDSSLVTALARRRTRPSTPTRSASGPRTRSSRPCPTTSRTLASSPGSSA